MSRLIRKSKPNKKKRDTRAEALFSVLKFALLSSAVISRAPGITPQVFPAPLAGLDTNVIDVNSWNAVAMCQEGREEGRVERRRKGQMNAFCLFAVAAREAEAAG